VGKVDRSQERGIDQNATLRSCTRASSAACISTRWILAVPSSVRNDSTKTGNTASLPARGGLAMDAMWGILLCAALGLLALAVLKSAGRLSEPRPWMRDDA
jgi:hypothetical protein